MLKSLLLLLLVAATSVVSIIVVSLISGRMATKRFVSKDSDPLGMPRAYSTSESVTWKTVFDGPLSFEESLRPIFSPTMDGKMLSILGIDGRRGVLVLRDLDQISLSIIYDPQRYPHVTAALQEVLLRHEVVTIPDRMQRDVLGQLSIEVEAPYDGGLRELSRLISDILSDVWGIMPGEDVDLAVMASS